MLAEKQDRADDAMGHYKTSIASKPSYSEPHYNLANILIHRGQFEDAAEHYRQALVMSPDHAACVGWARVT